MSPVTRWNVDWKSFMPQSEIKFLALDRDFAEFRERYLSAWEEAVSSGQVVGGPFVEKFERQIAVATGRQHAIAVSSGTDALRIALAAAGIDYRYSVIVPAISYIATAACLLHVGATPVFADVDEHGHIDLDAVRTVLPRTGLRAMVVVGLYGNGLDANALREFCNQQDILLVEDGAQSLGSSHCGARGGGLGVVSALSFAPTKTVPCFGNAGLVTTDDPTIAARARLLRAHGKSNNRAPSEMLGLNSALAATHAAQLSASLEQHEVRQRRRDSIAARYLAAIDDSDAIDAPPQRSGCVHNWHKFVVACDARNDLATHLSQSGIETQIHYSIALPDEPIFRSSPPCNAPHARRLARRCLSLPLHPHLTDAEVDRVTQALCSFHAG